MIHTKQKLIAFLIPVLLFFGAWISFDIGNIFFDSHSFVAEAAGSFEDGTGGFFERIDGGGGGGGFGGGCGGCGGGGFFGGGGGGGGGGFTPTDPILPLCSLNLYRNTISWTTHDTVSVTISPLTNSPSLGVTFAPNGSQTFVPPLGVGTHSYKLFAFGIQGSVTCQETIVVPPLPPPPPPPPVDGPTCTLDLSKQNIVWTTTNAAGLTLAPTTASPLVGNNLTLSGSKVFNPNLGTGTHTYRLAVLGLNGDQVTCEESLTVPPPPPPNAPFCELSATPSLVDSGDTTTLLWNTQNVTSLEIDQDIGLVVPTSGGSKVTPTITTTTTYTGTALASNGDTATCSATVTVTPPPPPSGPSCTLSVNKAHINPGESIEVSWTSSNVTSGFVDHNVGTTSPVSSGFITIFPSDDTEYTGTFTGPNGDAVCSATVTIQKSVCTGNCGGGINPPTVVLFDTPNEQPLAFVSLSQIPYTGFEAGVLLTFAFWFAVVLWSIAMTYIFVGKTSIRYLASHILGLDTLIHTRFNARRNTLSSDNGQHKHLELGLEGYEENDEAHASVESEYLSSVAPAPTQPIEHISAVDELVSSLSTSTAPAPLHTEESVSSRQAHDGIPDLMDVLESRANAAGVLVSGDTFHTVAELSNERSEVLKLFGDILNEAVKTLPRQDGWIHLSLPTLETIVSSLTLSIGTATPKPLTPFTSKSRIITDSAAERIVQAIVTGSRDEAFSLVKQLEESNVSATKVIADIATLCDQLYKARKDNTSLENVLLLEKAGEVPLERLHAVAVFFSEALSTTYALPYTGVKIALAQAFDNHT